MEQNKEIRQCSVEFHKVPESPVIEGRAIPFNVQSPNREGFREMITPEAVEGVLEKSDIFLLYNHDRSNGFLARNKRGKGSLSVDVREDGVYFAFAPGSDNLSLYIKDRIERGDLDEMSFAFTVAEDRWEKQADGVYDRTITKFDQIYDFSIVDQSYYGLENAVGCKRFAEVLAEEEAENKRKLEELEREEEAKRQEEEQRLKEYYENLRKEYLK